MAINNELYKDLLAAIEDLEDVKRLIVKFKQTGGNIPSGIAKRLQTAQITVTNIKSLLLNRS